MQLKIHGKCHFLQSERHFWSKIYCTLRANQWCSNFSEVFFKPQAHVWLLTTRRGGTEKILGGLIWASDWVPAGLSKRSATIGWRGAYPKIFGFTNPPYGRKRHFPIKNMFSPHFEILPADPASWSTWQILGRLNIPLAPHFFSLGGLSPPKPPRFRRHCLQLWHNM